MSVLNIYKKSISKVFILKLFTFFAYSQTIQTGKTHFNPQVQVDPLSSSSSVLSVEDLTSVIINDFVLLQNFPNPFNSITSISFQLQAESSVSVTIYDFMGNVVKDLFSGIESSGYKSINWDATNNNGDLVSTGMYFYRLRVGDASEVKRMMYLK
tara:strand:- start:90 stop:554 length:465 start_codon:yes stop_codon:yes gene_type:complete